MEKQDHALPKGDDVLDLENFGSKKKKKKKRVDEEAPGMDTDNEASAVPEAWTGSDRDYSYDELLRRLFCGHPDSEEERAKKLVLRPPQVARAGAKKTAFVNFAETARALHRQPGHLLSFLTAELGAPSAVDGSGQLVLRGRFQQKHIEGALRRYAKEFVTCRACRSPDTVLSRESRLCFLRCMSCHARSSLQAVQTGFQAATGKRSAERARAAL